MPWPPLVAVSGCISVRFTRSVEGRTEFTRFENARKSVLFCGCSLACCLRTTGNALIRLSPRGEARGNIARATENISVALSFGGLTIRPCVIAVSIWLSKLWILASAWLGLVAASAALPVVSVDGAGCAANPIIGVAVHIPKEIRKTTISGAQKVLEPTSLPSGLIPSSQAFCSMNG